MKMTEIKYYTHEEMADSIIGKKGTPRRDALDAQIEADVNFHLVGEAIREARLQKNMTQEELGELMGVQRAQVSRIEKGRNLTLATISRAFRALGMPARIAMGEKSIALW